MYHCRDTYSLLHDFKINLPHSMYSFKHRLSVLVWRLLLYLSKHMCGGLHTHMHSTTHNQYACVSVCLLQMQIFS